jgi:hypothetical protein
MLKKRVAALNCMKCLGQDNVGADGSSKTVKTTFCNGRCVVSLGVSYL